jgi:hypothetical protein
VCACVRVCVCETSNGQAAAQFGRLGEESGRLLAACEAERALRAKLEAGLQVKERQVCVRACVCRCARARVWVGVAGLQVKERQASFAIPPFPPHRTQTLIR